MFTIEEKRQENTFVVCSNVCAKIKQENTHKEVTLEIPFEALNLGSKIYGKSKSESKKIQKNNCRIVLKIYRQLVRVIKFARKNKLVINNKIVVSNLSQKQNNNDYMLFIMLKLKFDVKFGCRLGQIVSLACDFLDKENFDNKMCDFVDNKCAKHRAMGFDRPTGCCPANCKYMKNCPCLTKNISCKFIFCDYLENKGFSLSPLSMPVLVANTTIFQRLVSLGLFFKAEKSTVRILRLVNILTIAAGLILVAFLLKIIL